MSTAVPVVPPLAAAPPRAAPVSPHMAPPAADVAVRGPVLLATNGENGTDAVARLGTLAAARLGVAVRVVAVTDGMPIYALNPLDTAFQPEVDPDHVRQREAIVRDGLATIMGASEWPVDVRVGDVARCVADEADRCMASLVVVGCGSHPFRAHIIGALALRILRQTTRPILVVPAEAAALPSAVVAAVDFAPASTAAALLAARLLAPGGHLMLVHVAPAAEAAAWGSPAVATGRETVVAAIERWDREMRAAAERALDRLAALVRVAAPHDATIETRLLAPGAPPDALLAIGTGPAVTLVAAGTHAANVFERMFVGSTAEALLRGALQGHGDVELRARYALVAHPPAGVEAARLAAAVTGRIELTEPADWAAALDAFARRNTGRRVWLDATDEPGRMRAHATGYALRGVTYDATDGHVEFMLGNPAGHAGDFTHTIVHPDRLAFVAAPGGPDVALYVDRDRQTTALTFMPGNVAPPARA